MENDKNKYHLSIDEALLAFSVLKKLKAGSVASFDERLKSQKIQYLAQVFGVSPSYGYGIYLRGPYSSALADDLFALDRAKEKPDLLDFVPDELNIRFGALEKFIEGKTSRQLELVSTLHLFINGLKFSSKKAILQLKSLKQPSDDEIKFTIEEFKKIP